jgi:hypothetical protein
VRLSCRWQTVMSALSTFINFGLIQLFARHIFSGSNFIRQTPVLEKGNSTGLYKGLRVGSLY